jgi:anti-sigma regulatory factor (Ser/Thr protein kinase)
MRAFYGAGGDRGSSVALDLRETPMQVHRSFDPQPTAVGEARRFVAAALAEAGHGDAAVVDLAMLVTSELASNAVEHAGTAFEVTVETRPGLRIAVADENPQMPVRRDPDPLDVSGRGLLMLDATGRWGVEPHGAGKRVFWEYDR